MAKDLTFWMRVLLCASILCANGGPHVQGMEPRAAGMASAADTTVRLRTAAWPFFNRWRRPIYDSAGTSPTPHPAVARIIVPEGGVTAYGSGTLVDVRDQHGLVVTNWHVVRDSRGIVEVVFPGGFRSQARPLKVDSDWDLAALVIWRPPIEPVRLAIVPPQPGDLLTIHGYGQGEYRIATGRCTSYYAPRINFPREMVELDVEARQGDSGGPIFNERGELAGVLFGAGQGTTLGSFAPRVGTFLASLAPDIGQLEAEARVAVAERSAPDVRPAGSEEKTTCPNGVCRLANGGTAPRDAIDSRAREANYPSSPWSPPGRSPPAPEGAASLASHAAHAEHSTLSWQDITASRWFEPAESILAAVGLLAIVLRLVKSIR